MKARTELWLFMKQHDLTDADVGRILGLKPKTISILKSAAERSIRPNDFELLKLKVSERHAGTKAIAGG